MFPVSLQSSEVSEVFHSICLGYGSKETMSVPRNAILLLVPSLLTECCNNSEPQIVSILQYKQCTHNLQETIDYQEDLFQ